LTITQECDIVNKFEGIEAKVNSNEDCCEFTSENRNIKCENNHITEL